MYFRNIINLAIMAGIEFIAYQNVGWSYRKIVLRVNSI